MQQPPTPAHEKIMLALDVPDCGSARTLLHQFAGRLRYVKVGLQLFTAEGPSIVHAAKGCGFEVFLDLKLHDIPNTVAHAVESAIRTGAAFLTVHTLGGPAMLRAAAAAARGTPLRLLGVTLLTSMDEAECRSVGIHQPPGELVPHLAQLASDCGLAGCVASALEISAIRQAVGRSLQLVIPGIRPAGSETGDQRRVMGPREAIEAGADYLVIGRPITGAADPVAALKKIAAEISASQPQT